MDQKLENLSKKGRSGDNFDGWPALPGHRPHDGQFFEESRVL